MNAILIVGGAGKTGEILCKEAVSWGLKPVTLDDLSTGVGDRVVHGPLVKVDARQTPRVVRTMKEYGIQIVVHAALWSEGPEVTALYDQNLTTTMSLLAAVKETKAKKLFILNPPEKTREMLARILADCAKADAFEASVLTGASAEEIAAAIKARI